MAQCQYEATKIESGDSIVFPSQVQQLVSRCGDSFQGSVTGQDLVLPTEVIVSAHSTSPAGPSICTRLEVVDVSKD